MLDRASSLRPQPPTRCMAAMAAAAAADETELPQCGTRHKRTPPSSQPQSTMASGREDKHLGNGDPRLPSPSPVRRGGNASTASHRPELVSHTRRLPSKLAVTTREAIHPLLWLLPPAPDDALVALCMGSVAATGASTSMLPARARGGPAMGAHAHTAAVCPSIVRRTVPVATSQMHTERSSAPLTTLVPQGSAATQRTGAMCPSKLAVQVPDLTCHTRRVASSPAVTHRPGGKNVTACTAPRCAGSMRSHVRLVHRHT